VDLDVLSQSAERRLLEHRRMELGLRPSSFVTNVTASPPRRSPAAFAAAPAATVDRRGARIEVALTAWPADGLIVGAVVTVTVVVSNEGIEAAESVSVVAPAPSGTSYRPGTLRHDGREADEIAEALFGEGFHLRKIVAAGRTALTWKLDVLPGAADLIFAPTVRAAVPVIAARPLVLRRGKMNGAFRTDLAHAAQQEAAPSRPLETASHIATTHEQADPPFYELTHDEEIAETAVLAALAAQELPPVVLPGATPQPPQPALYRTIRPGDLSLVERLLDASLGLLPHFVFVNGLAVATTGDGGDPLGLAAFVERESVVLGRLKVAARLGKPLGLEDAACAPPVLDADPSAIRFVDPGAERVAGAVLLRAGLDAQRLAEARSAWERPIAKWLALRLVTLAFCAQGLADESGRAAAEVRGALAAYAMQARLGFIAFSTRMKLDRRLDPTKAATTQLDAAARALIEALRGAIGPA
jgi:uncharacterized repeat protein (TIGR01451 family)